MRLKRFLEMRGADAGSFAALCGAAGVLDRAALRQPALDAAVALTRDWSEDERQGLRDAVPRLGLNTPFRGRTLRDIGREVVDLAQGVSSGAPGSTAAARMRPRRSRHWSRSVEQGRSSADRLLADFAGPWRGDIDRVFDTQAF